MLTVRSRIHRISSLVIGLLLLVPLVPRPSLAQNRAVASIGNEVPIEVRVERLRVRGFNDLYALDYDSAGTAFEEIVRIAPDRPEGYLFRATNRWLGALFEKRLLSASLYSRDEYYAQKQIKVDPEVDKAFRADIAKAIEVAEAQTKQDAKNVDALYYLGAAHGSLAGYEATMARSFMSALKHGSKSVDLHEKVLELEPTYADAYLTLGMYHYVVGSLPFFVKIMAAIGGVRGSRKQGLEEIERVVADARRNSDDARVVLVSLYTREKRLEDALAVLRQLHERHPKNFIMLLEQANTLARLGRYEESFKAFDRLCASEPAMAKARDFVLYSYGEARRNNREWARAYSEYARIWTWVGADPDLVTLSRLGAGMCLDALGKRKEALAQYVMVQRRADILDSRKRAEEYIKVPYSPSSPIASTGQL